MEDNIYRDLSILHALRRHRRRFADDTTDELYNNPSHWPDRLEALQLKNHRDDFVIGLLEVLAEDSLESQDVKILSTKDVGILHWHLHHLLSILNDLADPRFNHHVSSETPSSGNYPFPALQGLLFYLDHSNEQLQLASDTPSTVFKLDTLINRTAARSAVEGFKQALNLIKPVWRKSLPMRTRLSSSQLAALDRSIISFDQKYRRSFKRILDIISDEFVSCDTPESKNSHEAMVKLADIKLANLSESDTHLDIYLLCPRRGKWQGSRCKVDRKSQQGSKPQKRLCQLLTSSLRAQKHLMLRFHESLPVFTDSYDACLPSTANPKAYDMRTLQKLIVRGAFNDLSTKEKAFNYPQRRLLAARLALNLLTFFSWCHTSRPWDGSTIHFLSSPTEDHDRHLTYFSCLLGQTSRTLFEELNDDLKGDDAGIRCFTEFARLLLEIEYGTFPMNECNEQSDYGWVDIRDYWEDRVTRIDASRVDYLKAVEACLFFRKLFRDQRMTSTDRPRTDEETCRKLIRTKIVRNLVSYLPEFSEQPSKEYIRDTESLSDPDSENEDMWHGTVTHLTPVAPTNGQRLKPSTHGRNVSFQEPMKHVGTLFDSQICHEPPETANSARIWLNVLKTKVQPIICCSRFHKDRCVKVAVLDTGIDVSHPDLAHNMKSNGCRVIECKDWTGSPHDTQDCVGHGTAVCDTIAQIAKFQLYVGKVSDSAEFNEQTPQRLAKAITHAAEEWDVDIIVLSLGFDDHDIGIAEAVQGAFNEGKIILAAASNSGSVNPRQRVAYPARIQGQVLSIRSATGQNVRSHSSPIRSDGEDNFMILGEGIRAAWPGKEGEHPSSRYVSGSSFATPVAAAIVCLVLEFSVQQTGSDLRLPSDIRKLLWSYHGIRRIFQYMSAIDDFSMNTECRMIYPWKLFDPNRDDDGCASEISMLMRSI